jgi:hypothetical protein
MPSQPSPENSYSPDHVELLTRSFRNLTGRDLLPVSDDGALLAQRVWEAPFFVASHDTAADPILTYGNRCALDLFAMEWEQFTSTPSRFTAEEPNREERAHLLERVSADGFIDDYSGVRISRSGQRFRIHRATVWNLTDQNGTHCGQAATFSEWSPL